MREKESIVSEEDFLELYESSFDKLFNYMYCRLLNVQDTEDLVSEIFLKAFENRSSFNKNKSNVTTWLFTIAKNTMCDFFRKRKSNQIEFTGVIEDIEYEGATEKDYIQKSEYEKVMKTLCRLSETDRSVIYLRYVMEFSYREIAIHMDIKEKNVGSILSRAMSRLRKLCDEPDPL